MVEILYAEKEALDKNRKCVCTTAISRRRRGLARLKFKFEVYLQALLSNVLDGNFLAEIHEDDDEYFLEHMEYIDNENWEHLRGLLDSHDLDAALVAACESFPTFGKVALPQEDEERCCDSCGENTADTRVSFSRQQYDELRLSSVATAKTTGDIGKTEFPLCALCSKVIELYSKLHHYRYNTFQACRKQVCFHDISK